MFSFECSANVVRRLLQGRLCSGKINRHGTVIRTRSSRVHAHTSDSLTSPYPLFPTSTGGCTAAVAIVAPQRPAGSVTLPEGVVVSKLFDVDAPTSIVQGVSLNVQDTSAKLSVNVTSDR